MTRKVSRNYSLSVVGAFVAILTLLIAAAVLAQTSGAGQTTGKTNAAAAPAGASAPAQVGRPLTPWIGAGSSRVSRSQTKRHGARPMDGNHLFLPAMTYPSGEGSPYSVAVADVNGDGKPDLLVANFCDNNCSTGSVSVLLGDGDGTFQPPVTYGSGGYGASSVAVADVNGDGKPDLVVTNWCPSSCSGPQWGEGMVGVLLGNGDGTFQAAVPYDSGGGLAFSVAIADMNGDGKLDLVVGNFFLTVSVLLGNGDGTFQPAMAYDVWMNGGADIGNNVSVAVADVNGDGKPDVVVAERDWNVVTVLLGNGDGTFQTRADYGSGGSDADSVAIGDVNGDGKPDLVVATLAGGTVCVLLNNGDGTFRPAVGYGSGAPATTSAAVADVNGDGKPDLVVSNNGYGEDGAVSVLLGNGDGTFQTALVYSSGGGGPQYVAVADVNGDGRPDLIVPNGDSSNVGVLLNNTGPHASTTTTLVSSPNPSVYGQAVTFTAAVSSASGTPNGMVIFYDGSTQLGSATLANGSASFSYSLLAAGSRPITAAYQGSTSFSPSTSAPLNQIVNPAATSSSLASSLNPALVNEVVTYTATVASQYGGAVTGTVVFQDGGSTLATVTIVGNQAAYSTKYGLPGTHSITATYSGDTNNTGSASATLVEQINKGFASKTVLTTSGSPSFVGQPLTFTAKVTSTHGTIPDGELVTFYDGAIAIGTGATAGGAATFVTSSLTARTHTIKGTYVGDTIFQPSTGTVTQVVSKYPTTTALSSSLNPSQFGQKVTFTAQVTSSDPSIPTGKVKFLDGTVGIGSATLSGGVATLKKSTLAVGTHPITAEYLGDVANAKSTSPVLNQVVQ
jgi:hypothetical protein